MTAKTLTFAGPGKPALPLVPVTISAAEIAAVTPERAAEVIEQQAWEASRRAAQPNNPSAAYDRGELVALLAVLASLTGRTPDALALEYGAAAPAAA